MKSWQIKGLNHLENSGYLPILRSLVKSHTCTFWWYDPDIPLGNSILHNGTISFVNTGNAVLAITANHVYEKYLSEKSKQPSIKCQVGNITVEPERYVISQNKVFDIVTFELPTVIVGASGAIIHNASIWPPNKLNEKDLIITGGYPGNRRTEETNNAIFDFVSFISRVSQSSNDHLSIYLNIPESHWPQGQSIGNKPNLGGISGSPVYRIVEEPIETIELAGFIYEASQEYELIFARHLNNISSDGNVNQNY